MRGGLKFIRAGRYGRIVGAQRERTQRVRQTQTYYHCDCVTVHERTAGTGNRLPVRCPDHGNHWYAVRTDPIEENE